MIGGPDVSSYQSKCNWPEVKAKGSELAVVKVTEGNNFTNPRAREQVLGAVAAGLLVMLYHFAQPNGKPGDLESWKSDARAEAKRFDDLADAFEKELGVKLFCWLDVERNTPLSAEEKVYWREWCNEFRRWSRIVGQRVIGFYSGKFFTMDLGFDESWSNTLLWVAQYLIPFKPDCSYVDKTGQPYWPIHIKPWKRADLWQDGGGDPLDAGGNASTCPGIEGGCDYNHFAGTREQLEELIAHAA